MFRISFVETMAKSISRLADSKFDVRLRRLALVLFIQVIGVLAATSSIAYAGAEYRAPSGELLGDPTRPQKYSAPKEKIQKKTKKVTQFKVNYVMNTAGQARAMVNGKKVRVGDSVQGAVVKDIKSDSVLLRIAGVDKRIYVNRVRGIKK